MIARRRSRAAGAVLFGILVLGGVLAGATPGHAQSAPSRTEAGAYDGLLLAAHQGDLAAVTAQLSRGADTEVRDGAGRTPMIVAAFGSHDDIVRALLAAGADADALEHQAYDVVTIAAVANDLPLLDLVLDEGANPGNVTSPYEGTALIAAAHLGHHAIVERLIEAGAPLDHVNNLHWTALIEAVVLGDGGADHVATVRALAAAGADRSLTDRQGHTALDLARSRGYDEMVSILGAPAP